MKLVLTNKTSEVEKLVAEGWCPVECSIGGESIVDSLQMDHHGTLSHLESVAVRAYRDHYGARAHDQRFVGVGVPDADMCFAIASLAGIIPHPNRDVEGVPPHIAKSMTKDLSQLAETIARVDTSPIGLNIPDMEGGDILLLWNAMTSGARDTLGMQAAVCLWRTLCEGNPHQLAPFLDAAKTSEENRRLESLKDYDRCGELVDGVLVLKGSRTFGFPEWYGRKEGESAESINGWKHPVVLAWIERTSNVTIGCPNDSVAEELFGEGGLKNVLSKLQPEGWGGRESIGGSPRGQELSWEQVEEAAKLVAEMQLFF